MLRGKIDDRGTTLHRELAVRRLPVRLDAVRRQQETRQTVRLDKNYSRKLVVDLFPENHRKTRPSRTPFAVACPTPRTITVLVFELLQSNAVTNKMRTPKWTNSCYGWNKTRPFAEFIRVTRNCSRAKNWPVEVAPSTAKNRIRDEHLVSLFVEAERTSTDRFPLSRINFVIGSHRGRDLRFHLSVLSICPLRSGPTTCRALVVPVCVRESTA